MTISHLSSFPSVSLSLLFCLVLSSSSFELQKHLLLWHISCLHHNTCAGRISYSIFLKRKLTAYACNNHLFIHWVNLICIYFLAALAFIIIDLRNFVFKVWLNPIKNLYQYIIHQFIFSKTHLTKAPPHPQPRVNSPNKLHSNFTCTPSKPTG